MSVYISGILYRSYLDIVFPGKTDNIQNAHEMRGHFKEGKQAKNEKVIHTVHLFIQSLHFPLLFDKMDFARISFPVFVISAIDSHT